MFHQPLRRLISIRHSPLFPQFQVCERLVDSNMSHGVSIKMIVEAFNPSMPIPLQALFKPTASIQPPHQMPLSRPATAASASTSSSSLSGPDVSCDNHTRPMTAASRPGTSYCDAGGLNMSCD